jgi:ubiquinone/menaquinone biosynthesis C-methylase UbiE
VMSLRQSLDRSRNLTAPTDASTLESRRKRTITCLDRLLPHVPLHRALTRSVECLLFSEVEVPAPVLDLGCGDGTFAHALFETPLEVGVDPDRKVLRWASEHGAHRSLVIALGAFLPFRSEAFASVLCNSTLEHIPEEKAVLQEMRRVLAPGGTCILTVPSDHFLRYHLGSFVARCLHVVALARIYERWIRYVTRTYHCDPPHVWRQTLEETGFLIASQRYYFTAASTRAMDAAQYLSAPSLLTRWLLGRWVLWRGKGRYLPLAKWLSRLVAAGNGEEGAFLFFHCRKEGAVSAN